MKHTIIYTGPMHCLEWPELVHLVQVGHGSAIPGKKEKDISVNGIYFAGFGLCKE